jgi:hypothetical protein
MRYRRVLVGCAFSLEKCSWVGQPLSEDEIVQTSDSLFLINSTSHRTGGFSCTNGVGDRINDNLEVNGRMAGSISYGSQPFRRINPPGVRQWRTHVGYQFELNRGRRDPSAEFILSAAEGLRPGGCRPRKSDLRGHVQTPPGREAKPHCGWATRRRGSTNPEYIEPKTHWTYAPGCISFWHFCDKGHNARRT